jgi:hypothetical protein
VCLFSKRRRPARFKPQLNFPTDVAIDLGQSRTVIDCNILFTRTGPPPRILHRQAKDIAAMAIHRKILEWQATHPNITWFGWGIVWMVVLAILLWPRKGG